MPPPADSGRYRIGPLLGEGGMSRVYRARDTVLGRDVALKLLKSGLPGDDVGRARLLQEARLAAGLSHPSICVTHDVGEMDGRPFVTMELLEGETLADLLTRRGRLDPAEALAIFRPVCAAVAAAHAGGVIHRDLKPGNVMVLADGRVKVLDFGLARSATDPSPRSSADVDDAAAGKAAAGRDGPEAPPAAVSPALTVTGALLGTIPYLAPEQARLEPADARSDVYSLGVLLYEMLRGRHPYAGEEPRQLLQAIQRAAVEPFRSRRRELSPDLDRVLRRCLQAAPGGRYRDAGALLAALPSRAGDRPGILPGLAALGLAFAAAWLTLRTAPAPAAPPESGPGAAGVVRRLTFGGDWGTPFFLPGTRSIAFGDWVPERPGCDFLLLDLPAGEPRRVARVDGTRGCIMHGVSADGRSLLIWLHPDDEPHPSIWRYPVDGGPPTLLLRHATFPDASRSHGRLAYAAYRETGDREIRIADPQGRELRTVYRPHDRQDCYKPKWSPEGARLAFQCFEFETGITSLHLADLGTGTVTPVAMADLGIVGLHDWMADGRALVVGGRPPGESNDLWRIPLDGTPPVRLTTGPDEDAMPSVSWQTGQIAFQRKTQRPDVRLVDLVPGGVAAPGPPLAEGSHPGLTAPGEEVVLLQTRNGAATVVAVADDGAGSRVLSPAGEDCGAPLAVGPGSALFACQARRTDGAGGRVHAGSWPRTIYRSDGGQALPRALLRVEGRVDLLAASPAGRLILYRHVPEEGATEIRQHDTGTGRDTVLADEPPGHEFAAAAWLRETGRWRLARLRIPGKSELISRRALILEMLEAPAEPPAEARETGRSLWVDIGLAALSGDGSRLLVLQKSEQGIEVQAHDAGSLIGPEAVARLADTPAGLSASRHGRRLAVWQKNESTDIYLLEP